jgi:acetyl esterase/lipase
VVIIIFIICFEIMSCCTTTAPYETIKDVSYYDGADAHSTKHKLDLYLPNHNTPSDSPASDSDSKHSNRDELHPVVLFIHGGGWKKGDRQYVFGLYGNVGRSLAEHGFVTAVASYRLSWLSFRSTLLLVSFYALIVGGITFAISQDWITSVSVFAASVVLFCALAYSRKPKHPVKHPAHAQDCARAIKWVRDNIRDYGGDPTRIFLCGHSAGAHLVSLVTLDQSYLHENGFDQFNHIRGVLSISGPFCGERMAANRMARRMYMHPVFGSDEQEWPHAFPLAHVPQCANRVYTPPFLLLNASQDFGLELHTDDFAAALKQHQVPVQTAIVPSTNHISIIRRVGHRRSARCTVPDTVQELLAHPCATDLQNADQVTIRLVVFMREILQDI